MADETTESIETAATEAQESAETETTGETEATTGDAEATEAPDTKAEATESAEVAPEATEAPDVAESAPTVAAPAEAADAAPTGGVEPTAAPVDAFGTVLQVAPALAPGEPLPVAVAAYPADGVARETVLAATATSATPTAVTTVTTVSDLAAALHAQVHTLAPDAADVAVEFVAADDGQPGKGLMRVSAKEQSVAAFVVDILTHNLPTGWVATPAGTAPDNVNQRRLIYLRCEHDSAD